MSADSILTCIGQVLSLDYLKPKSNLKNPDCDAMKPVTLTAETFIRNVEIKIPTGLQGVSLFIPGLFTAAASISAYFDSLKHIHVCQLSYTQLPVDSH